MPRDNFTDLEAPCPKCGETSLTAGVTGAAHDHNLLDIIVECEECGHRLNAFVNLTEMEELE